MTRQPTPLEVDPARRDAARAICGDFDELLDGLITARVFRCGDGGAPPRRPGVYLFAEDAVVMHVGRTGDLQRRRREQTGLNNDRHTATFAFRAAAEEAQAAHVHLRQLGREALEQHPDFHPYFIAWKERVRDMDMRCIEIDSPSKRHVFEMMASLALGLPEHLWDEH